MSEKFIGQGTTITFSNDGFTTDNQVIGCAINFTLPTVEVADIEINCIANSIMEKIGSRMRDMGQFLFEYAYDPTDTAMQELETRQTSGEVQGWRIDIPQATATGAAQRVEFSGYIQALTPNQVDAATLITKTAAVTLTTAYTVGDAT